MLATVYIFGAMGLTGNVSQERISAMGQSEWHRMFQSLLGYFLMTLGLHDFFLRVGSFWAPFCYLEFCWPSFGHLCSQRRSYVILRLHFDDFGIHLEGLWGSMFSTMFMFSVPFTASVFSMFLKGIRSSSWIPRWCLF